MIEIQSYQKILKKLNKKDESLSLHCLDCNSEMIEDSSGVKKYDSHASTEDNSITYLDIKQRMKNLQKRRNLLKDKYQLTVQNLENKISQSQIKNKMLSQEVLLLQEQLKAAAIDVQSIKKYVKFKKQTHLLTRQKSKQFNSYTNKKIYSPYKQSNIQKSNQRKRKVKSKSPKNGLWQKQIKTVL